MYVNYQSCQRQDKRRLWELLLLTAASILLATSVRWDAIEVYREKRHDDISGFSNSVYFPFISFIYFSVLSIILSPVSDLSFVSLYYFLYWRTCNALHIRLSEGWYFLEILLIALTRGSIDRNSCHIRRALNKLSLQDCGLVLSSEAEGRGCYPLDDHVLCKSCNAKRVQALTSHMTTEL